MDRVGAAISLDDDERDDREATRDEPQHARLLLINVELLDTEIPRRHDGVGVDHLVGHVLEPVRDDRQLGRAGDADNVALFRPLAQDAAGRLLVADLCGGNFHDYMTVPNQIAEHRYHPEEGCYSRIQVLDAEGNFLEEWTHITPLSIAVYGDYVYASDKMSNLAILEAATGKVIDRVDSIAIYIHQLAVDAHGDLYTASVYPEHAKEKRGREGPSHRRWTRQKASNSLASA